jgi:hypothetical protein
LTSGCCFASTNALFELNDLINQSQVILVMEDDVTASVLGEDSPPESDPGFKSLGRKLIGDLSE